jgi:hypothetical protein
MLTGGPSNGLPAIETIADLDGRADHEYWLVFNECEQHWQCDAFPQEAAIFYHDEDVETMYGQGADPDARLIVGGINASIAAFSGSLSSRPRSFQPAALHYLFLDSDLGSV